VSQRIFFYKYIFTATFKINIMKEVISGLWSLNNREKLKGLALAIFGAVLALVWGAIGPVVTTFLTDGTIDFSVFKTVVNWITIGQTALASALAYYGVTFSSGKK
jgi:hypothetical protein